MTATSGPGPDGKLTRTLVQWTPQRLGTGQLSVPLFYTPPALSLFLCDSDSTEDRFNQRLEESQKLTLRAQNFFGSSSARLTKHAPWLSDEGHSDQGDKVYAGTVTPAMRVVTPCRPLLLMCLSLAVPGVSYPI